MYSTFDKKINKIYTYQKLQNIYSASKDVTNGRIHNEVVETLKNAIE